jgi:hypothetical protein
MLFVRRAIFKMRALNIALTAALVIGSGFSTFALAADREITVVPPLERMKPADLDKAKGVGPRVKFSSAPHELSPDCALSVGANVNEDEFVDYFGGLTVGEFRTQGASRVQMQPSEAKRAPLHEPFALGGEGQISGASCVNLKAGHEARGFCSGAIGASGYTIVYRFDPVVCDYDNIAVAKALIAHLSVGGRNDPSGDPDCATKLEGFIIDIDDLLANDPRRITDVWAVLDRHFPLHGCAVDEASRIVMKSKYFKSVGMNGPKKHVFSLSNGTLFSSGLYVIFGITDTGHSSLPFAMWSRPSP